MANVDGLAVGDHVHQVTDVVRGELTVVGGDVRKHKRHAVASQFRVARRPPPHVLVRLQQLDLLLIWDVVQGVESEAVAGRPLLVSASRGLSCRVGASSSVGLDQLAGATQVRDSQGKERRRGADEVGHLLSLRGTHLHLPTLWIHADVEVFGVDDKRNLLAQGYISELLLVLNQRLFREEVVILKVEEDVDEPAEGLRLEQVQSGLVAEEGEVGEDGPELSSSLEAAQTVDRGRHVDVRIDEDDQLWQALVVCPRPHQVELTASTVHLLFKVLWRIVTIEHSFFLQMVLKGLSQEVQGVRIGCRDKLRVLGDLRLLTLINFLHGCLEQALRESGQVMDGAVQKKLLDEVLAGEGLQQPQAESNVLLQRLSDETQVVWKYGSLLGPQSNG